MANAKESNRNHVIFIKKYSVLHSHWGVEAIVVDYVRPSLFGGSTVIPNIAHGLVWVLSAFALGGLYYFN